LHRRDFSRELRDEIVRRSELLLLDDLISFAIAARRLVELTKLKSHANKYSISLAFLNPSEKPFVVTKLDKKIGFLTLVNRIIHASMIRHFDSNSSLQLAFIKLDIAAQYQTFLERYEEHEGKPFEQLLLIASDDADAAMVSLLDIINASIKISDKIVETCARDKIFLELSLRGAD